MPLTACAVLPPAARRGVLMCPCLSAGVLLRPQELCPAHSQLG